MAEGRKDRQRIQIHPYRQPERRNQNSQNHSKDRRRQGEQRFRGDNDFSAGNRQRSIHTRPSCNESQQHVNASCRRRDGHHCRLGRRLGRREVHCRQSDPRICRHRLFRRFRERTDKRIQRKLTVIRPEIPDRADLQLGKV